MDDPTTTTATEGFGLMFYNARWYDPYITHFSQPDTIVPDPYNPQDWNRYAYVRYNPIRYNDPSGHDVDCGIGDSYCNDAKREYHYSWRKHTKNSTFKIFMKAKDAYGFYYKHPDTALKDMFAESQGGNSWEDIDPYTLASIYSENVEHQMFNPVSDQFMLWEIDRLNALQNSGQDVDPLYYYSLAAAAFITFGPDGGSGGGGDSYLNDWASINFNSVGDAFNYHYALHGGPWSSRKGYTQAAKKFYNTNVNLAVPWTLKDGSEGLRISTNKYYGIYTMDGKIVSFGQH